MLFRSLTRPSLILGVTLTLLLSNLASISWAGGPCDQRVCAQPIAHHQRQQFVNHHYQPYIQQQLIYPIAVARFVAVESDPYSVQLVGSTLRQEAKARSAVTQAEGLTDEVTKLRNEVARLTQAIAGGSVTIDQPKQQPAPQPAPNGAPQPQPAQPAPQPDKPLPAQPASGAEVAAEQAKLTSWVWNMFQTRCANCHSGNSAKAGLKLFEDDKVTKVPLTAEKLILIDQSLYSNEMPKGGQKLNTAEYTSWRGWMQLQTKAIRDVARPQARKTQPKTQPWCDPAIAQPYTRAYNSSY